MLILVGMEQAEEAPQKVSIGIKLQQVRIRRGLSQTEMGAMLGLAQASYWNRERDKYPLFPKETVVLCRELNIDPRLFFTDMSIADADLNTERNAVIRDIELALRGFDDDRLNRVREFIETF